VQEQLAALAARDPLTGILNRRTILERLAEELSRATRQRGDLTVAMCDVDHFKAVNDAHGHQVGDEVLRGFTASVQAQLRKYDSVGRYGGEEFLVIAPGVRDAGNVGLFERLCDRTSRLALPTARGAISITVSIGVTSADRGSTVDMLLAAADAAMYRAKAEGRNRVAYGASAQATTTV
jgi:two-component system, cell cycle response regulator